MSQKERRYPSSLMTGRTASSTVPCRSMGDASFPRPFTHDSHQAAAGRCVNAWRAMSSVVGQMGCRTAFTTGLIGCGPKPRTSSAMGASTPDSVILTNGWNCLFSGAPALGPGRRAQVAGHTTVDQHELSAVLDPHLQVPQAMNTRQRRDGRFPRAQKVLKVSNGISNCFKR